MGEVVAEWNFFLTSITHTRKAGSLEQAKSCSGTLGGGEKGRNMRGDSAL